jgi:ribosome-binding protein aMBF1 (putative translation factor)
MARAALGWSLQYLSERAKVHLNTVRRCELGYETLTGTLQKIEAVFRNEGVIFLEATDDAGPGIRVQRVRNLKPASASPRKTKEAKPNRRKNRLE